MRQRLAGMDGVFRCCQVSGESCRTSMFQCVCHLSLRLCLMHQCDYVMLQYLCPILVRVCKLCVSVSVMLLCECHIPVRVFRVLLRCVGVMLQQGVSCLSVACAFAATLEQLRRDERVVLGNFDFFFTPSLPPRTIFSPSWCGKYCHALENYNVLHTCIRPIFPLPSPPLPTLPSLFRPPPKKNMVITSIGSFLLQKNRSLHQSSLSS